MIITLVVSYDSEKVYEFAKMHKPVNVILNLYQHETF